MLMLSTYIHIYIYIFYYSPCCIALYVAFVSQLFCNYYFLDVKWRPHTTRERSWEGVIRLILWAMKGDKLGSLISHHSSSYVTCDKINEMYLLFPS